MLAVGTCIVRFDVSHPEVRAEENAQQILLSFLPFFHTYGLIMTVFMTLAAGILVVTLPRFSIRQVLGCIEKYKASKPLWCICISQFPLIVFLHFGFGVNWHKFFPGRISFLSSNQRCPPPTDSVWTMMIVWRLGGTTIRTALCWVVYDSGAYVWTVVNFACWFTFGFRFCVFV